jgi:CxxC motif-containing protein
MKKELFCIGCPMGCYLSIDYIRTTIRDVSGNRCKLGLEYAKTEIINPERTLTTTLKVKKSLISILKMSGFIL